MNLYRKLRRCASLLLRINWLPTLYLNFKMLPFRQARHLPLIITSRVKFRKLSGSIEFQCPIKFGLVIIGKDVDNMPISFVPAQLFLQGKLIFQGPCIINKGANVVTWPGSSMTLGAYTMICSGVTIKATREVSVGKYAMISSGSFIMDSNIHCIRDMETGRISNPDKTITIGDYCWLAMNATVLGGAKIPSHSVLSRQAFVNHDLENQGGGNFCRLPRKIA